MTVVVTGAAGFVGRHVVGRLVGAGVPVTGIDRRPWTPVAGERSVVADLVDAPAVDGLLRRADGVIHLAARAGVRDRGDDVAAHRWRDNVLAGARVLEATPDRTPVVVASSSSVYGGAGPVGRPRACRETDPLRPGGGYARSKVVLERLAAQRAGRGGLVGVVRPFTVAGEGQRPDMAVATWIDAMLDGRPVTVLGSPDRRRDVTDVRDVAEGLVRMLEDRIASTVNLGTGVTHRLADIVAVVAARCGARPPITVAPAIADDVPTTRADVTRCRRLLGLVPHADLAAVVDRQVRHATGSRATTGRRDDAPRAGGADVTPPTSIVPEIGRR